MAAKSTPEPTTPAPEAEGSGGAVCSNCGKPAVVTTDGKVANVVSFCEDCKPDNIAVSDEPEPVK